MINIVFLCEKQTELWDINSEFWEKTSPNCEIKVNSAVESGFHILMFFCVCELFL